MTIQNPGEYSLTAPKPDTHGHHDHEADSRTVFGFWLYLMTDCVLFGSVFAAYAVLHNNTAGGPSGKDIFDLSYVLIETFCLLLSSITYGFASMAAAKGAKGAVLGWLAVTFLFGLVFMGMEFNEFHHLIAEGFGPDRSAFLSSFFTLVGMHGGHVTVGLIWILAMMVQVATRGLGGTAMRRLRCLSLFWHFLDIVWICVFTTVYLLGSI